MSNQRSTIPHINHQVQENYMVVVDVVEDPETGEPVVVSSTPLRWLLDRLEKILFVETLTGADAETTSDPEAFCPVCLENYKLPCQEATPGLSEQAIQITNEKPLKLECGHIFGKNCLRRIINPQCLWRRECPLCRHPIHTNIRDIPLSHSDGKPDIVGALCCAIRLYLRTGSPMPETHAALNEWVHANPPARERTPEENAGFVIMRSAVETWEEVGAEKMREWIDLRMSGGLPDEEF